MEPVQVKHSNKDSGTQYKRSRVISRKAMYGEFHPTLISRRLQQLLASEFHCLILQLESQ